MTITKMGTHLPSNSKPRLLFYCHDTMGLGHIRRTLLLAQGIRERFPQVSCLLLTGSSSVHRFSLPEGIDYVKLPCVRKIANENYASRFLDLEFSEIRAMRERIIRDTALAFRPHLFFVDNVPLGMKGEIVPTLKKLRASGRPTGIFLVLRDILDSSGTVCDHWRSKGVFKAVERYYDRVFVFGESKVFDPCIEYRFPPRVAQRVRFCGYLPRPVDRARVDMLRQGTREQGERLVLVTVGGGADGRRVIEEYLRAAPMIAARRPIRSLIVLGPDADPEWIRSMESNGSGDSVRIVTFCEDVVEQMGAADAVVSMGGYNTINELMWLQKPCVIVPRIEPRSEQLIRSRRLQQLGLIKMIHPHRLNATVLADGVLSCLNDLKPPESVLRFDGLDRLSRELKLFLYREAEVDATPETLYDQRICQA